MTNDQIKTESTPAGLKVYYPLGDNQWGHIKTVKCKYEPIIKDLSWVKDFKRILPTKEERLYLEMKYQIWSLDWPNAATKEFVNKQDVVSIAKIQPRGDNPYYVVIMSEGTEVRVSVEVYTLAVKLGMVVPEIKRLQ